jgi:hypothetical protein
MSGYLTRLLARAAPPDAVPAASSADVHPPVTDEPRADADPFETTIVDPLEWPSTTRPDVSPPPMLIAHVSLREPGWQREDARHAAAPPRPLESPAHPAIPDGRTEPTPQQAPLDAITIAETLRPAPAAEPAPSKAPEPESPPAMTPRPLDDGLAIADRFMSSVLPPALLPPPAARQDYAREIVRERDEVRTTQVVSEVRPITPPTPAPSLTVTVVPPPQAAPARPASSTSDSRVVVVRNGGVPPPGVPSFSRFS